MDCSDCPFSSLYQLYSFSYINTILFSAYLIKLCAALDMYVIASDSRGNEKVADACSKVGSAVRARDQVS